jgi:hypothetical protein
MTGGRDPFGVGLTVAVSVEDRQWAGRRGSENRAYFWLTSPMPAYATQFLLRSSHAHSFPTLKLTLKRMPRTDVLEKVIPAQNRANLLQYDARPRLRALAMTATQGGHRRLSSALPANNDAP